jgi:hypothetical protein
MQRVSDFYLAFGPSELGFTALGHLSDTTYKTWVY